MKTDIALKQPLLSSKSESNYSAYMAARDLLRVQKIGFLEPTRTTSQLGNRSDFADAVLEMTLPTCRVESNSRSLGGIAASIIDQIACAPASLLSLYTNVSLNTYESLERGLEAVLRRSELVEESVGAEPRYSYEQSINVLQRAGVDRDFPL